MTSEYTSVGLNCEVSEWQVEPSWAIWTSQATGGSHMLIFFTWKLSNIIHYLGVYDFVSETWCSSTLPRPSFFEVYLVSLKSIQIQSQKSHHDHHVILSLIFRHFPMSPFSPAVSRGPNGPLQRN